MRLLPYARESSMSEEFTAQRQASFVCPSGCDEPLAAPFFAGGSYAVPAALLGHPLLSWAVVGPAI